MKIRRDSIFKFAEPYFDEVQTEYTWGIIDLPPVIQKDDDHFYTWRESDRLDVVAYKLLGDPRFMFFIMHYNQIADAMTMDDFIGETIRIPSKETLEKVYLNVS